MKSLKIYRFLILAVFLSLASCGNTTQYLTAEDPGTATIRIYKNNNSTSKDRYIAPKNVEIEHTLNSLNGKLSDSLTSNCPSTGDVNLLIIPVKMPQNELFMDDDKRAQILSDLEIAFFTDSNDKLGHPSLKSFLKESSFGKINISGTITDWFDLNDIDITSVEQISSEKENVIGDKILPAAVEWASNTQNIDVKDFDSDKNGAIDAVYLIYDFYDLDSYYDFIVNCEPNIDNSAFSTNLTTITSSNAVTEFSKDNPAPTTYTWMSFAEFYKGYSVLNSDNRYELLNIENIKIDTHPLIHEQGHLFGLNDFASTTDPNSHPTGKSTMMDESVGDFDSYSKMILGWITPYVVYGTSEILLPKVNFSNNCVIVIPTNYDEISQKVETAIMQDKLDNFSYSFNPFSEYLMIDLYTPDNLNYLDAFKIPANFKQNAVQSSGVRIHHVDSRIFKANYVVSDLGTTINYVDGYEWDGKSLTKNQTILCPISNSDIEQNYYQLPEEFNHYDRIRLLEANQINNFDNDAWANETSYFDVSTEPFKIEKFGYRFFNGNYTFNNGIELPFNIKVETLKGVNVNENK